MGIRRLGRPENYNYPIGLNAAGSPLSVEYVIVAGGGAGGGGGTPNGTNTTGAGGGGWGASGGSATPGSAGSGGKAVNLNGKTVTWTSSCTTRVYGSVA